MLIFEHAQLYNLEGELPRRRPRSTSTTRAVRRAGTDVTLITYGGCCRRRCEAAETLAADGIEAEVIDLRVLRPLDDATIMASVRKTRRAVIVDEGWRSGSLAAEIIARIIEQAFYDLDAPPARVCSAEVPIPYAKHLEDAALPQAAEDRRGGAHAAGQVTRADAMIEFELPSLGADMDEGTLVEWRSKPGEAVKTRRRRRRGRHHKAAVDVEIWDDGTVAELLVAESGREDSRWAPCWHAAGSRASSRRRRPRRPRRPRRLPTVGAGWLQLVVPAGVRRSAAAAPVARQRVSPAARQRARELGVDLDARAAGSGPQGAVTRDDVEPRRAPAQPPPSARPRAAPSIAPRTCAGPSPPR